MNFLLMVFFFCFFFFDLKSLEAWPYVRLIQYRFCPIRTPPSPPFDLCMTRGYVCNLVQRIYQIARIFGIHRRAPTSPDFALRSPVSTSMRSPHTRLILWQGIIPAVQIDPTLSALSIGRCWCLKGMHPRHHESS